MAPAEQHPTPADSTPRAANMDARVPAADAPVNRLDVMGIIALLIVATVLAYLPAMRGGFLWDDDGHVTKPELRSFGGLYRIWFHLGATQQYYPMSHSAFWLEHKLWGDNTLGYHLTNVLLHAAAACLVYLILNRLKIPGARLAAAIFAVHPVEVESVAWISEQKNTLSAVFYLSAMLAYLRFDKTRKSSFHTLALSLFTLGLLTKTVTATLPAALLVIFWWQRGKVSWRNDMLPMVPFFVLGAAAGAFTAWVERKLIGAEGAAFELSIMDRALIAGRAIWFYLAKLFWPTNLIFVYPRWQLDPTVYWQWLFPLATLGAFAMLWAIRDRWRAPLAAALFFVGTLFPALGFLNVYPFVFSFVADHFQYLASLGVIALVAAGLMLAVHRLPTSARRAGNLACGAVVVGLAVLTMLQCSRYGNAITIYQTTIERNPECWMACNNLGAYLMDQGREQEAAPYLFEAIRLRPDYPEGLMNLGVHLAHLGHQESAIKLYQHALRVRPEYAKAEDNWGNALVDLKRPQEAIEHFQASTRLNADEALPEYNLANTLRDLDQLQPAVKHYEEALRLRPNFVEAHYNLGIVLATAGQLAKAIEHFQVVLKLRPEYAEAHQTLGDALLKADRAPEAIEELQTAIRLDVNCFPGYVDLARAYARTGASDKAITTAEKALNMAQTAGKQNLVHQIEALLVKFRAEQGAKSGLDQSQDGVAKDHTKGD